jgi:hypothetical protein
MEKANPKGNSCNDSKIHWSKKWAPSQPHENNKHVLNGKALWYNKNMKRWVPDWDTKLANLTGATKPEVADANQTVAPSASKVSMANQLKQLNATFASFKEQLLLDETH